MHVELRDEARDDLVDGAIFYGEQSADLDQYFLKCLRVDIEKLQSIGGIHEQYRGFYRSLSERFPYAIYYLVSGEFVDVVAILDCGSNIGCRTRRLSRRSYGQKNEKLLAGCDGFGFFTVSVYRRVLHWNPNRRMVTCAAS